ncbi:capsule biosynthesis protein [Leptospira mtsangambouensis]|uniref:capsule biosynthesis protein n=1 Tax=Leptospira mtsangambouensis TaxID=2484912 RepID=UPI001EEB8912|nr:capsule biosynthesis protein [Leptospira mtsangambouensis]MCG6142113.1 capsule biosynthesis protein [Leptospira mtsangambouensis]
MKILIFSPFSAIWTHSFPEASIADALIQEGNEVLFIHCDRIFSEYCVAMSAHGLNQFSEKTDKQTICERCNELRDVINSRFKFESRKIESYLSSEDKSSIEGIINSLPYESFESFQLNGIPLGRIALYEVLLQYKKSDLNFNEKEWESCKINLRNTLYSYFASLKIIEREKPDRILIYNTLYAVNQTLKVIGNQKDIPVYFLHAGENLSNRLSTMIVSLNTTFEYRRELISKWEQFKNSTCTQVEANSVKNHFLTLFQGKHFLAYSHPVQSTISVREFFKISPSQKIIVATMSSYDERFAGETIGELRKPKSLIFNSQIEWISELIKYFKNHSDLFLIIRVHPREFPNKRDGVRSKHSLELEEIFKELPNNSAINWPTDNLSIYDLAKETDLFLNAWSSVGEEMSLFGIPVLIYSPELLLYPAELNYVATNKTDYFEKLCIALKDGLSFENTKKAFRWYALRLYKPVFKISDDFHHHEDPTVLSGNFLQKLKARFVSKKSELFGLVSQDFKRRNFNYSYDLGSYKKMKDGAGLSSVITNKLATKLDLIKKDELKVNRREEREIRDTMNKILSVLFDLDFEKDKGLYKFWNDNKK